MDLYQVLTQVGEGAYGRVFKGRRKHVGQVRSVRDKFRVSILLEPCLKIFNVCDFTLVATVDTPLEAEMSKVKLGPSPT